MYGEYGAAGDVPSPDSVPQVDVVTAVHALYARFIPSLWKSLRAQTHSHWRWWIEIDGEPGQVNEALRGCGAAADPRVRVSHHGPDVLGPAITRNLAFHRGTAPFVQTADSDDELEPGALALLTAALGANRDAGYALGQARDLLTGGELRELRLPLAPGVLDRGALPRYWITGGTGGQGYRLPAHPAGAMYRRALVAGLGAWQAAEGMEDTALLMSASASSPGVLIADPTLRYRRHPDQRSARMRDFAGGGVQIRGIRSRVAALMNMPPWRE
ncbi:MAG: glycosyltransferase [Streptomyces sp.]|uniref:glycosyltransferase n=1 Tax=Streptomyces sp. TaxID=1931 RepID=UPI003D6A21A5